MPRRKKAVEPSGEKPRLGLPDPLEAAQEAMRHAQEGSLKLSRSVDVLRSALETIIIAEQDLETQMPVSVEDLKGIAKDAMDKYSEISGQNWRKHKLIGNWAGEGKGDPRTLAKGVDYA